MRLRWDWGTGEERAGVVWERTTSWTQKRMSLTMKREQMPGSTYK
ncbi:hypothetical protein Ssi03_56490 [Sphaerisporangium siamense]|uniref:Uncharacterized protein n=1 Tax=Sphaerisporangium siamense TaxID=795645 RepID=A0A7W7DAN0_9ACTN|nr:hypothetical protein [Sphaerisporangium siamense]GII86357.1 hypothetical protein Ssi03_43470 [Sphaerisporangium siamense]GII87659.1 hypothetical protein Ssi03_56490 [Sphaerisporangium siamense]